MKKYLLKKKDLNEKVETNATTRVYLRNLPRCPGQLSEPLLS